MAEKDEKPFIKYLTCQGCNKQVKFTQNTKSRFYEGDCRMYDTIDFGVLEDSNTFCCESCNNEDTDYNPLKDEEYLSSSSDSDLH